MHKKTLILTSTIRPTAQDIKHKDFATRKIETINSIYFYAESGLYDRIILVDNSGESVKKDVENSRLALCEFIELSFHTEPELYAKHGGYKAVGEMDSLNFVLMNIEFEPDERIFKVTSRYIIYNHDKFVKNCIEYSSAFIYFWPFRIRHNVYTSIYMTNVSQLKGFIESYTKIERLIGYNKPVPIETVFGMYLHEKYKSRRIKHKGLPEIVAISGTNGSKYSNWSWREKTRSIFAFLFGLTFEFY
jgi:hypothetical protein